VAYLVDVSDDLAFQGIVTEAKKDIAVKNVAFA